MTAINIKSSNINDEEKTTTNILNDIDIDTLVDGTTNENAFPFVYTNEQKQYSTTSTRWDIHIKLYNSMVNLTKAIFLLFNPIKYPTYITIQDYSKALQLFID